MQLKNLIYFILVSFVQCKKPNIIVIIADDLGHNDVGFLNSNQLHTPNIDALAYNGIILDRFYAQATCSPSRAAFLTGNYPIRSGMYGYPIRSGENRSIPLDMPTMPEQLKKLGYTTHLVGKWHLGTATRKNLPNGRGFDHFFGYWNGFIGYFNYSSFAVMPDESKVYGFDLHDQLAPAWSTKPQYTTSLLTERTLKVIDEHDPEKPLFLMVGHLAPHVGLNGTELGVPNATEAHLKYSYIKDPRRRLYAEMVNQLDQSVGEIVAKLHKRQILDNSIILFFSDNGAEELTVYDNAGSNWPLRGAKFSAFEGGVRTPAVIFSPLFKNPNSIKRDLIHLTDWLPTFYSLAGGDVADLGEIDGIDQSKSLSEDLPTNRTEILVQLIDNENKSAFILKRDHFLLKYVQGTWRNGLLDGYLGERGRDDTSVYNHEAVLSSKTNQILETLTKQTLNANKIDNIRGKVDIGWCRKLNKSTSINCIDGCLFDIHMDPCEANEYKPIPRLLENLLKEIKQKIDAFQPSVVRTDVRVSDINSNPKYYNNTWCTWLDDDWCYKTNISLAS